MPVCWYGYYIFQLALPAALLYLTELLDRKEGEMRVVRPLWPPLVCYAFSVLLVMTNDLHQLVFIFDPGGNWASDYSYGPGYWIVAAFSLLFFALALVKLFCKGRRSKYWGGKVFPLLLCCGPARVCRHLYLPHTSGVGERYNGLHLYYFRSVFLKQYSARD